jgi:hypothetical protein
MKFSVPWAAQVAQAHQDKPVPQAALLAPATCLKAQERFGTVEVT